MKTKKSFPRIFTLVCVLEIPLIRHQENSQDFFKKTFLTWSKKCEIYERMVEFDVRRNLHICERVWAIPATQKIWMLKIFNNSGGEKTKRFGKFVLAKIIATLSSMMFFSLHHHHHQSHTCMRFLGCTFWRILCMFMWVQRKMGEGAVNEILIMTLCTF